VICNPIRPQEDPPTTGFRYPLWWARPDSNRGPSGLSGSAMSLPLFQASSGSNLAELRALRPLARAGRILNPLEKSMTLLLLD